MSRFRLRELEHERISFAPDESIDVRRKRIFERIKLKAERDGKVAAVENGVLLVDNVRVYLLANGSVRNG